MKDNYLSTSVSGNRTIRCILFFVMLMPVFLSMVFISTSYADVNPGLELYEKLLNIAKGKGDSSLFEKLNIESGELNWDQAKQMSFKGNLRLLKLENIKGQKERTDIFFVRKLDGEIFILSIPEKEDPGYANLENMLENKMVFNINVVEGEIDGKVYKFCRFAEKPEQAFLDRVFKTSIILLLFFVMVGMGLTLTLEDFALVFSKPKGVIIGELLQFAFMPLLAVILGYVMGFHENYPFIFVGMVLITAAPGGVTSNLMTYYAKGDVALSICLTSISTVLSIIFLPLLLGAYCANIPDINVPVKTIASTIIILVIIPIIVGMSINYKWKKLAGKLVPFFSALGIVALLFLIIGGVLSNLDKFADTERYGVKFYTMVILLTLLGMFFGAVVPKIFKVSNYQARAISLETGLRNASLAMAVAILIQDVMGDFYSSMFVVSGTFGLAMYFAGIVSIKLYKVALPVDGNIEDRR
jgi:predicted Na+-dependent transporter